MIQYITTLITYECNRILFHITPCHDGSHCAKQIISQFEMQTLK